MATLLLSSAGSGIGSALGGPLGSALGFTLGAVGGRFADRELFKDSAVPEGAQDIKVQTSAYGAAMARVYGTARVAGQIIWATPFKKIESGGQGKGGGGSNANGSYYQVSIAVALGEGVIDSIHRIWFDGQIIKDDQVTMRFYSGDREQRPDPLIAMQEEDPPAYRGCAYVVFENLDLSAYGNRLPQMNFEVRRGASDVFSHVKAVNLIPGTTEWGYHSLLVRGDRNTSIPYLNRNTNRDLTDVRIAIEQLKKACPNCRKVSLVVSWFATGTDARTLRLVPKLASNTNRSSGRHFVMGHELPLTPASLGRVKEVEGRLDFDGTPSDRSVYDLIKRLKSEGFEVMFHPHIIVDEAETNWRGDIGINSNRPPAHEIAKAIEQCFPSAVKRNHFFINSYWQTVRFAAPTGWSGNIFSLKAMIYHYANLCKLAGGVDNFLLGSELKGLTQMTSGNGDYPFVDEMVKVAKDVKAILPRTKVSYGANWDEYQGHVPRPHNYYFHLDPFWASKDVDFVAINYHPPLSDWRDDIKHLDAEQTSSPYDVNYLRNNIHGGEGYDWSYPTEEDRNAQRRVPIADNVFHKSWMYRSKDFSSWWRNRHHNITYSIPSAISTAWREGMKSIVFTSAGCPAVDKGANKPDAFPDRTSLQSLEKTLPYFSNGGRDDYMQSNFILALLTAFDSTHPNFLTAFGASYNEKPMLKSDDIYLWGWDARPYPWFPQNTNLWKDAVNWATGHWLNGRQGASDASDVIDALFQEINFQDYDSGKIKNAIRGIALLDLISPRDIFTLLGQLFSFDIAERNGKIEFIPKNNTPVIRIEPEECVLSEKGQPLYEISREQQESLPSALKLYYVDGDNQYQQGVVQANAPRASHQSIQRTNFPIVSSHAEMASVAEKWLREIFIAREILTLRLPPSHLALDVGDVFTFRPSNKRDDRWSRKWRITNITDEDVRIIEAVRVEENLHYITPPLPPVALLAPRSQRSPAAVPHRQAFSASGAIGQQALLGVAYNPPQVAMMDLPHLRGDEGLSIQVGAQSAPRPDSLAVYRSLSGKHSWRRVATLGEEVVLGEVQNAIAPSREGLWDRANRLRVRLPKGELFSRTSKDVLDGANYAAVQHGAAQRGTGWEIMQFANADLLEVRPDGSSVYELSLLLRGLAGTEMEMHSPLAVGAAFVLLEEDKLQQITIAPAELNQSYHYRIGPTSEPYSGASFLPLQYTHRGINKRPLSVVHAKGVRLKDGALALSWVRRSRDLSQTGWGENEIPLGETQETYEVEIFNQAGKLLHTLTTAQPHAIWQAAEQPTNEPVLARIYQLSARFGRGAVKEIAYV